MRIGVPREVKPGERRVAITPDGVAALAARGHEVLVERDAGRASGHDDAAYRASGARIVDDHGSPFDADLVVKVKELQRAEYALVRRHAMLVGFQQFAIEPAYRAAALASGATFVACECIEGVDDDRLPVLGAMSRLAGAIAVHLGAAALLDGLRWSRDAEAFEAAGVVLGGMPGLAPARVVVIGAGAAGGMAARTAAAMSADVTVFASSTRRFAALQAACSRPVRMDVFSRDALRAALVDAHLVVGAVLVPGRTSPVLIDRATIATMPRGSVFVDIGIDQRGIAETSRMTTIDEPFFVEEGVLHCGVPNLPALVPRSATAAYAAALLPYVVALADRGRGAFDDDRGLAAGLAIDAHRIIDARLRDDVRA